MPISNILQFFAINLPKVCIKQLLTLTLQLVASFRKIALRFNYYFNTMLTNSNILQITLNPENKRHNLHFVNIFTDLKFVLSKFNFFIAQFMKIYFTN
jgi:hypothetical protein